MVQIVYTQSISGPNSLLKDWRRMLFVIFFLLPLSSFSQGSKITGQCLSSDGQVWYFSEERDGQSLLYKKEKMDNGDWSPTKEVKEINSFLKTGNLRTPFISYDKQTLYFSAKLNDQQGYDIYYAHFDGQQWQTPLRFDAINIPTSNDGNPSVTADNMSIYFTRRNRSVDEGTAQHCRTIYVSKKNEFNKWSVPETLSEPINVLCESNPVISADGKVLYFSSDRASSKRRKPHVLYSSELVCDGVWGAPTPLDSVSREYDMLFVSLDYMNRKVSAYQSPIAKNGSDTLQVSYSLPERLLAKPHKGSVVVHTPTPSVPFYYTVHHSLSGELIVFGNSATLAKANEFNFFTDADQAIVSVYSKNTNKVVLLWDRNKDSLLVADLFNKLTLDLQVYDDGYYLPINTKITVITKEGNYATQVDNKSLGQYTCEVPLGKKIHLTIEKDGFERADFNFMADTSTQYSSLVKKVLLKPQQRTCNITIEDATTHGPLDADVSIENIDQSGFLIPNKMGDGSYKVKLRKTFSYRIKVTKAGYMQYVNEVEADNSVKVDLQVQLMPLDKLKDYVLPNIQFNVNATTFANDSGNELLAYIPLFNQNTRYQIRLFVSGDAVSAEARRIFIANYLLENGLVHPNCKVVANPGAGVSNPKLNDEIIVQFK